LKVKGLGGWRDAIGLSVPSPRAIALSHAAAGFPLLSLPRMRIISS